MEKNKVDYCYILSSISNTYYKVGFSCDYMERSVSGDIKNLLSGEADYLNSYYIETNGRGYELEQYLLRELSEYKYEHCNSTELITMEGFDFLMNDERIQNYLTQNDFCIKKIDLEEYKKSIPNVVAGMADDPTLECFYCNTGRTIDKTNENRFRIMIDKYDLFPNVEGVHYCCRTCGRKQEAVGILLDQIYSKKQHDRIKQQEIDWY